MAIMDRAKRTLCRLLDHQWVLSYMVGNDRESRRSYRCERCSEQKVVVNGVTLDPEDAKEVLDDMHKSMRATMWLLDNVEPTYSAETIDGKTVIKHDGEVIDER